jgi:CLIP-associating protein 1/2
LEFEKDLDKEVQRAAEDCANVLALVMDSRQCVGVLNPISDTAEFPINLAASRMQEKVIKAADPGAVRDFMAQMVPTLKKSFENSDSSGMRKSSMLCLVYLHEKVGDDLLPLIADLNPSKMKLLSLYIRRSQEQRENAAGTPNTGLSEPTSPTSPPVAFSGLR